MKAAFPDEKVHVELVKGDNGVFEVEHDGKLVFSKASKHRFPAYQEVPMLLLELGV